MSQISDRTKNGMSNKSRSGSATFAYSNYLKPTFASRNRTRVALSDVTSEVGNRSHNVNSAKKNKSTFITTRQNRIQTNKEKNNIIHNDHNHVETSRTHITRVYNDEPVSIESVTSLSQENSDIRMDQNSELEEYDDRIEPLLPIHDEESQRILDTAFDKYFSTIPDTLDEDTFDSVMVIEYSHKIFNYLRELELKYTPNPTYMNFQSELKWSYRTILLDWIVQVHERFNLLPETLYLAVNIIDRFLSRRSVTLNRLQLVGATAVFIAAKYEEINCPSLKDMVYILDDEYTAKEIIQAEKFMIDTLEFELGWPGPMSFLRRISKADDYDCNIRTLTKYLLETTIMDPKLIASPSSWLTAGAYYLSKIILQDDDWSLKHVYYSGYTREQILPIVNLIFKNCKDPETKHLAIYQKYSTKRFHESTKIFKEWSTIVYQD